MDGSFFSPRARLRCLLAVFCAIVFWQVFSLPAEASGTAVDEIHAVVEADSNLPPLIQGRMQASVQTISEQLMLGHTVDEVQGNQSHYEQIIHEVFDKVLVGYSVRAVSLKPGNPVLVHVSLLPWTDVIHRTQVDVTVDGMSPEVETLVRQDIEGIDKVFSDGLNGLPIAATDWTNGVLKRSLNEFMQQHLPEFRADFDMDPQETAAVQVTVYPRLPVVRTVDLNMRSGTVPNLSLINHRSLMQEKANLMIGVPVAFAARHADALQHIMETTLDSTPDFRVMHLHTKVDLKVGENTVVMSRSDTDRYRMRVEGWADIGRAGSDKTMFRAHIGRKFSPVDEIFLQSDFYPQSVSWDWAIGYARGVTPDMQLDVRYDVKKQRFIIGAERALSRKWLLRYEYRWTDQRGEAGIRYKIHDFLSLEYVIDKDDRWLRLIGNF